MSEETSDDMVTISRKELREVTALMHGITPQYRTYTINVQAYLPKEEQERMGKYPDSWLVLDKLYKWLWQT